MVTWYWILEYAKVLGGYTFLMFLWPSVVFRKYLSGKSKIFRFGFCVTTPIVIINTVVLTLGLFHLLHRWLVMLIFYGIFLVGLLLRVRFEHIGFKSIRGILLGTYGIKSFLLEDLLGGLRKGLGKVCKEIRPRFGEYLALGTVLLYGLIYFSYGAFQDHSYGFGDLYTHHTWIYGLIEGKIFSAGIYPEGMHCFIYCMYALFDIKVFDILLFLQGIHTIAFLLSAYCFLREVFHIRYTPVFVLTLFLILDLKSYYAVASMSRLQWTLPQEFGLHTQFLCAAFLIRYLYRTKKKEGRKKKRFKLCWDENLLIFMMALAASITTHFYPMIMAFFLCASFAVFLLIKIFSKGHFIPLVIAVMCGLFIAAAPMAGAYASGIEFQDSIGWAMNIINGSMGKVDTKETQTGDVPKKGTEETGEEEDIGENSTLQEVTAPTFSERISAIWIKIKKVGIQKADGLYHYGYTSIYGKQRADIILKIIKGTIALWIAYRLFSVVISLVLRRKKRLNWKCFDRYPPLIFAAFVYMLAYAGQNIGLPQLVDGVRLCSSIQMLTLAVVFLPVDMFLTALALFCKNFILQLLTVAGTVGIYVATITFGFYHGYLYFELTRYNAAVMVTNSIIETLPRFQYTIVAPTDELYPTILDGRHEELVVFLEKSRNKNYTLPTEYVFIYVEKKPLWYAQNHYFHGPSWLAWDREIFEVAGNRSSRCPAIEASTISKEEAQKDIMQFSNRWLMYTELKSRVILESKAYEWCQRFVELYPFEMNIYYEDDDFVCYYFRQEPNAPYNLGIG